MKRPMYYDQSARLAAERRERVTQWLELSLDGSSLVSVDPCLMLHLLADLADAEARAERAEEQMRERCAEAAASAFRQRDEMSPAEIADVIRAVPLSETLTATRRGLQP